MNLAARPPYDSRRSLFARYAGSVKRSSEQGPRSEAQPSGDFTSWLATRDSVV